MPSSALRSAAVGALAPEAPEITSWLLDCGSTDTVEVSRFGATPCKAQWRCKSCLEPFERFKCH